MPSAVGGLMQPPIAPAANPHDRGPGDLLALMLSGLRMAQSSAGGRASFRISGVTRDSNGNALGACTVMVFYTGTDQLYSKVVSDAAGVWACPVPDQTTRFYAVSFNAAGTQAGATVNNLTGS